MSKRILSVLIVILLFSLIFSGCSDEPTKTTKPVISNGCLKIGALLPSDKSSSQLIENGIRFANSLANSVNLDETVEVSYYVEYYNDKTDVNNSAENLINNGVSVIIFDGDNIDVFSEFTVYVNDKDVVVLSLSPFGYNSDKFFSFSLSPKHLSSCAATYAMEKGYNTSAVLLEHSEDYYSDFADTYISTFSGYVGTQPTVYYINGDSANYSPAVLSGGEYDYLFLVSSQNSTSDLVNDLRLSGYSGEIMLVEVMDKSFVQNSEFDNCSFISKIEPDGSNNVATVFYSMYSSENDINESDISPAVAYGYDSYMIVFETLKSFVSKGNNQLFSNVDITEATTTVDNAEICVSDFTNALANLKYMGVTDVISFENNSSIPTCVYVDTVFNSNIVSECKYSFASKNIN